MSKPNFIATTIASLMLIGCTETVDQSVKTQKIEIESSVANEKSVEAVPAIEKPVVETLLSDEEYRIEVNAVEMGPTKVKFSTSTNLPLPVQVMAGISLQGQNPNDTWIGFNQKITLKKSEQTFILDFPKKPLPGGTFDAEVTFYPRWGAKNGNPIAAKIGKNVEGLNVIALTGDGQKAEERMERDRMQLWVMENVNAATPYIESNMRSKLGYSEPVAVTRMNPNIIKGHYFPKADMTIYVNTLKNEYVTFRKGRDTNGM